jgi:hypothetical protein
MALIGMKYVNPDSVLARTAWEMVQTHAGGLGPHDGMTVCPVCGERLPCSVGRAAAEVVAGPAVSAVLTCTVLVYAVLTCAVRGGGAAAGGDALVRYPS